MKEGLFQSTDYFELNTPVEAIYPLFKHIPEFVFRDSVFWECTGQNSNITKIFKSKGYKIFETHINNGIDFLKDKPKFHYDFIITNPPYKYKNEFLERCYNLKKPFALLLPLTSLGSVKRFELFAKHGVSLIVLNRRIDFTGKKNNWFYVAWFIWKPVGQADTVVFANVEMGGN